MGYNITFITTSNNIADLFIGVNNALPGLFSGVILSVIWISFFGLTIDFGTTSAFISASLITTIFGGLLLFSGLTTWPVVVVPVILFLFGIGYRFFSGK